MTPKRIQRKRVKGWKMPPNTLYVGRGGKWGNPFATAREFLAWLAGHPTSDWEYVVPSDITLQIRRLWILDHLHELAGKNLACWCRLDQPCHADILLALSNKEKGNP